MSKLSIDQHREAAAILFRMRQDIERLRRITDSLPAKNRVRVAVEKLVTQESRVRFAFDGELFAEYRRTALVHATLYFRDGGAHPED